MKGAVRGGKVDKKVGAAYRSSIWHLVCDFVVTRYFDDCPYFGHLEFEMCTLQWG